MFTSNILGHQVINVLFSLIYFYQEPLLTIEVVVVEVKKEYLGVGNFLDRRVIFYASIGKFNANHLVTLGNVAGEVSHSGRFVRHLTYPLSRQDGSFF